MTIARRSSSYVDRVLRGDGFVPALGPGHVMKMAMVEEVVMVMVMVVINDDDDVENDDDDDDLG